MAFQNAPSTSSPAVNGARDNSRKKRKLTTNGANHKHKRTDSQPLHNTLPPPNAAIVTSAQRLSRTAAHIRTASLPPPPQLSSIQLPTMTTTTNHRRPHKNTHKNKRISGVAVGMAAPVAATLLMMHRRDSENSDFGDTEDIGNDGGGYDSDNDNANEINPYPKGFPDVKFGAVHRDSTQSMSFSESVNLDTDREGSFTVRTTDLASPFLRELGIVAPPHSHHGQPHLMAGGTSNLLSDTEYETSYAELSRNTSNRSSYGGNVHDQYRMKNMFHSNLNLLTPITGGMTPTVPFADSPTASAYESLDEMGSMTRRLMGGDTDATPPGYITDDNFNYPVITPLPSNQKEQSSKDKYARRLSSVEIMNACLESLHMPNYSQTSFELPPNKPL